jgi:hypothetical protein
MVWFSIAAAVVAGFLGWELYRRFASDRIAGLIARRRSTSRMIGRAELVDGNRHLEVALAMTASTLFYENPDMQGSLDLQWIREIEYDTELATGLAVHGSKVLRVRSDSQTFEFVLPNDDAPRWHMNLPPRRAMERAVGQ